MSHPASRDAPGKPCVLGAVCVALVTGGLACSSPGPGRPNAAPPLAAALVAPAPAPRAPAPHGGAIVLIAVTDAGDAAVSIDELGELRVWPSLDGKAPPVPVPGIAQAAEVALARTSEGLLVALRDTAGDLELVRLTAAGAELGRMQISGGVPFEQIAIAGESVLARRSDQVLVRFDARGGGGALLAAPPGEQIGGLAARAGGAIAITGGSETGFRTVRVVDLAGRGLRWGAATELLHPATTHLALSPTHRRLAMESAADRTIELVDLTTTPVTRLLLEPAEGADVGPTLAFLDEDRLAIAGRKLAWRSATGVLGATVLAITPAGVEAVARGAAGDRVYVASSGGNLVLATDQETSWLGYRVLADTRLAVDGAGHFVLGPVSGALVWLDGKLAQTRRFEVRGADVAGRPADAIALDATHVVVMHAQGVGMVAVELVDVEHPVTPAPVVTLGGTLPLSFDVAQKTMLVLASGRADRYVLDLAAMRATKLAPLLTRPGVEHVWLTDPARANGVTAYAFSAGAAGNHFDAYTEAPGNTAPVPWTPLPDPQPTPKLVAADGTAYDLVEGHTLLARRGVTQTAVKLPPDLAAWRLGAVSNAGELIVVLTEQEAIALDPHGAVRWRVPSGQDGSVTFASDDREVVIGTPGGLVAYDAATGAQIATGCGWSFGRWTAAIPDRTLGVPPVCLE